MYQLVGNCDDCEAVRGGGYDFRLSLRLCSAGTTADVPWYRAWRGLGLILESKDLKEITVSLGWQYLDICCTYGRKYLVTGISDFGPCSSSGTVNVTLSCPC